MGARRIPRPAAGRPGSPEAVFEWLEYLCLSSDCRGVGGYELAESELVRLEGLRPLADGDSDQARADALRSLLRSVCSGAVADAATMDADRATLCLLGLTPATFKRPRATRRAEAAAAMGMATDTFQKRYERKLLLDVAHEVWRVGATTSRTAR